MEKQDKSTSITNDSKKPSTTSKSAKNFQITVNKEDTIQDVLAYIRGLKPNYMIACKERAPTTGHINFHIYIQFPNSRRLSLQKLKGSHVEKTLGSPKQNIAYIKKDGDIICEEGSPRLNYMPSIKEAEEMTPEERKLLPLNMYNIVKQINAEERPIITENQQRKQVKVFYIWGDSGVGKTNKAFELINGRKYTEITFDGRFWLDVSENCDIALYDDWRDSHMKPSEFIKFIDYNSHVMNKKGGSVRNNYKEIYITTVQDPKTIYSKMNDQEPKKQWERRMTFIHVDKLKKTSD